MKRGEGLTMWLRVLTVLLTVAAAAGTGGCDSPRRPLTPDRVVVRGSWNSISSPEEKLKFMAVLDQFTEQTGIPVQYREPPRPDLFVNALYDDIAGGQAPDVVLLPQPGLLETLAHCQRVLTPLPDSVHQTVNANYTNEWRRLGEVDGTLYGVLFKAANKSIVWYDTKAFATARVQPPATWQKFLEVAKSVLQVRSSAVAIGGANQWVLTDWFENVYLRKFGPAKYDALARHDIPWTDPSVQQALRILGELWGSPELVAEAPATMTLDQSVKEVFEQHHAGMVFEGDFLVNQVERFVGPDGLGTDAKFFDFPSFDLPPSVMAGGDIAVMTNDNDNTAKLMQYLASPDSAKIWAAQGGLISANRNVPLETYPDAVSRQSATELINAKMVRFDMSDLLPPDFGSTPNEGLWSELQKLLTLPLKQRGSKESIKKTLTTLDAQADSAYKRQPRCPGS